MVCYSDEMEDLEAAEKKSCMECGVMKSTAQKSEELAGARISDKLAISYRASESSRVQVYTHIPDTGSVNHSTERLLHLTSPYPGR